MLTRLQLQQTAQAQTSNLQGLELVAPHQIHEVHGVSPEYDGLWLVTRANHRWTDGGHIVNMNLQRVADVPTAVRTESRVLNLTTEQG